MREVAILKGIRPFVTLSVPDPIYQSLEAGAAGEAFMGYRMIPGEPLSVKTFAGIADAGVHLTHIDFLDGRIERVGASEYVSAEYTTP